MTAARMVWGLLVVWWLAVSAYTLRRMMLEPEWVPPLVVRIETTFGIKLGRRGAALLSSVPALVLLTLPLWHPDVRRLVVGW